VTGSFWTTVQGKVIRHWRATHILTGTEWRHSDSVIAKSVVIAHATKIHGASIRFKEPR